MADGPDRDRFVRFADVANGNSIIDGTKSFVQALVICYGADTTFTGSDFLFCIVFGIEFLAVCVGCLVRTFIGSSMVVVCGVDECSEKGIFSLLVWSVWPMRFSMEWGLGFC